MKNNSNIINTSYNKYSFYHNEWYLNAYYFDKNKNVYNPNNTSYLNNLFNLYINKQVMYKKKYIKNNNIIMLLSKYKDIKNYKLNKFINFFNIDKNYNAITNNIFFNVSEIKYFTNKVIINIFIYNREKLFILRKLRLLNTKNTINIDNSNIFDNRKPNNSQELLINKLNLLNNKLFLYKYYTSKLFLNNIKFNTGNIYKLRKILSNMYEKNVIFNITGIKYFHLNNNILLDSIINKFNTNRNSSILTLIRKCLRFAKIANLHFVLKVKKLNNYLYKEIKENYYNFLEIKKNNKILPNIFIKSTNTHMIGLKLEAKGRLTKRLVASRAIKKLKYKGTLNNIYSSVNRNSVLYFKGFDKSNISFSNKDTYNLLGSYGIKYWISTY